METEKPMLTVQTKVEATIEHCWKCWTTPANIVGWNNPSDEWQTKKVEINLKNGGQFLFQMELKDGSFGFDHTGIYDKIVDNQLIEYTVSDGRKSIITFKLDDNATIVTETFEPEATTPIDVQKKFVQGVLDNFKRYAENKR